MKKDFFLNGFTAIAIVGMALSACTDNEPDYGLGTEAKGVSMLLHRRSQRLEIQRMCCLLLKRWIKVLFLQ